MEGCKTISDEDDVQEEKFESYKNYPKAYFGLVLYATYRRECDIGCMVRSMVTKIIETLQVLLRKQI